MKYIVRKTLNIVRFDIFFDISYRDFFLNIRTYIHLYYNKKFILIEKNWKSKIK
jgi:hypothetical protein